MDRRKEIVIVAFFVVAVIIGLYAWKYYSEQEQRQYVGWFNGAYAEYYGETYVLFVRVEAKFRLEILEFNSSHIKWLTYIKVKTPLGEREYSNTSWVNIKEHSIKNLLEDTIYIEGIGARDVYIQRSRDSTFYLDKECGWPLKIRIQVDQFTFDMNLVKSNVPALKRMLEHD